MRVVGGLENEHAFARRLKNAIFVHPGGRTLLEIVSAESAASSSTSASAKSAASATAKKSSEKEEKREEEKR